MSETPKSPSGTHWRIDGLDRVLTDIGDRTKSMDERLRVLEIDVRSGMSELRTDVRNLRDLIDQTHRESEGFRKTLKEHDDRLDALEIDKASREGEEKALKKASAVHGAAAGAGTVGLGGAGYLLWKFIEGLLR